jgi:hypothetical protein
MPEFKPEQSREWYDDGLADTITSLEHEGGVFEFRGWTIRYDLAADNPDLGERIPAEFDLVGITDRYDIAARVWEGVPEVFRKVLLYHEVQEATLALGDANDYFVGGRQLGRMKKEEAHAIAEPLHWAYAERVLSDEDMAAFREWDAQLPRKSVY